MKELIKNFMVVKEYSNMSKLEIFEIIIFNIISISLSILIPVYSAKIIVDLTNNDLLQLFYAGLILLIVNLIITINYLCMYMKFNKIYTRLLINMQCKLSEETLKIENKELDKIGTGLFSERLMYDTDQLASLFRYIILDFMETVTQLGYLVAIFLIDKVVFIYIVVTIFFIYIISKKSADSFTEKDKLYRKEREKDVSFIGEVIRGTRDIKMLSSEDLFINKLHNNICETSDMKYSMIKTRKIYGCIIGAFKSLKDFLLIMLLIYLIINDQMVISTALIIHNYISKTGRLDRYITQTLEEIKSFNLSVNRITEVIGDKFSKDKFGTKEVKKLNGDIEFKNVKFGYKNKLVLNDMNFKINKNHTVAFVGKTGCGKTTIFNLICKLYDIKSGEILLDNNNISELNKDSIRGNITIINQNPYIFNLSIKDNIKLVKENVTDKEIKEACKLAYLDEFIEGLKDGYDTFVGEGGVNLSGGQRQRLAIARALVQKTEIILFDEATSSLDNMAEREITKAINNLKGNYTVIIIAHRLSTIKNCDNIFYLENGKVLEQGKHKELLNKCLPYKKLYEKDSEVVK